MSSSQPSTQQDLIRQFGNQWLPLQEIAFWREFQGRFPNHAEAMYLRAAQALERLFFGENP